MATKIPVLLIPGLLCDGALWECQIKSLKDIAEFTVANTTKHDSIPAIARDVLKAAPAKFALFGQSMGGYVSLEIMRHAPERVTHLGLINTTARPDTAKQAERRRMLLSLSKSGQFKGVTPRLLPMLLHPDRIHDPAVTGVIMDMAERVGRDAFFRQQTAILSRVDSRPFLKDINCPTMAIAGHEDSITPPDVMHEISETVPGAHYECLPDCGHMSPLEQPVAIVRLMRQLLAQPGAA